MHYNVRFRNLFIEYIVSKSVRPFYFKVGKNFRHYLNALVIILCVSMKNVLGTLVYDKGKMHKQEFGQSLN